VTDCTACGCCCFSSEPDYIAVFAVDEARMDEAALALTVARAEKRFMRFEGGRCSALTIENGRVSCSIYAMRPDACRWLLPDSAACHEQIREKSARVAELSTQQSTIGARRLPLCRNV
jgi:Fe-S-cluster containining protein